jgi:hypothetical protein
MFTSRAEYRLSLRCVPLSSCMALSPCTDPGDASVASTQICTRESFGLCIAWFAAVGRSLPMYSPTCVRRHDNADKRLTARADAVGLVTSDERRRRASERWASVDNVVSALESWSLSPHQWRQAGIFVAMDGTHSSAGRSKYIARSDNRISSNDHCMLTVCEL